LDAEKGFAQSLGGSCYVTRCWDLGRLGFRGEEIAERGQPCDIKVTKRPNPVGVLFAQGVADAADEFGVGADRSGYGSHRE
jgi:hypothetical protein